MRKNLLLLLSILSGFCSFAQCYRALDPPGPKSTGIVLRCHSASCSGAPLIIIDGAMAGSSWLSSVNPNDILGIDILKGSAAAAIYGSAAMNGVIIITTKLYVHLPVLDADNGKPILNANVRISGGEKQVTTICLITNNRGEMDLSRLKEDKAYRIEISCAGYQTRTITFSKKDSIRSIEMKRDGSMMPEVVLKSSIRLRRTACRYTCTCPGLTLTGNKDSIAEKSMAPVQIFPNPVSRSGTITMKSLPSQACSLEVVNAAGQKVLTKNIPAGNTDASVDLNLSSAGVYFIRVSGAGAGYAKKLVVY